MTISVDRMSTTDAERKLRAELVGRAAELVPLLAANAQRTEDERNVVGENIEALEAAGMFALTRPKRFGGFETGFRTNLEVCREVGRGCGSTSWTLMILNICSYFTGMWNPDAQQDVWGQASDNRVGGVLTPSGTADVVDGGFRVSGTWSYASGCAHTQWSLVGVVVRDGDGSPTDQGLVLIPSPELTVKDTWFVSGMKGTGSNTLIGEDIFVPAHRFVSMVGLLNGRNDNPFQDETLYRTPFMPAAEIVLVGPQLGLAQAALDLVVEKSTKRGVTYTEYEQQKDSPTFQLAVARAASLLDCAHLLAYRACADIDEQALAGNFLPDYAARARVRMDTGQSIVLARDAIRELVSAHGAGSFAEVNPLQRIWRDSEVASRHAVANPEISAQVYGRALLGFTEGITPLV